MLQVNNLTYSYVPDLPVLKGISFTLEQGEHLCVMGESGCGKSTLLKALYGLLDLDHGEITWKGESVLGPAYNLVPGMPAFKYMAQESDLMPFTSVADNVAKYLSRIERESSEKRTGELLEVICMLEFADTKVKNLSGGQKQRVALARALARNPELLLLDEPFSQVDNFKKNALRRTLFRYLKEKNISCIVATHDSDDALSFSDRMLVIENNEVAAYGSPGDLFKNPPAKYVASLFNDVNEVVLDGKKHWLYPHQIKIVKVSNKKAQVSHSFFKGTHWLVELQFQGVALFVNHNTSLTKGESVFLEFFPEQKIIC